MGKGDSVSRLEKVPHLTFIVVCLVAVVLMIEARFKRSESVAVVGTPKVSSLSLHGVNWKDAPVTVILQLNPTCWFCTESMPFYRRLTSTPQVRAGRAAVVVVTAGSIEMMRSMLASNQINVNGVIGGVVESDSPAVTPTVFVVDSRGAVKRQFVGKFDSTREEEVISHGTTGWRVALPVGVELQLRCEVR